MPDRPPIVSFLLAFTGLIAVALGLAAFSPAPEPADGVAPAGSQRKPAPQPSGAGTDARTVKQPQ